MESVQNIMKAYGIGTTKQVEDNLVKTDIGLIDRGNANYLYTVKVLTRKGNINGYKIKGMSKQDITYYSYLRQVADDIANEIPTLPTGIYLDLNDYITLMKTGELKKVYEKEGSKYAYKASYPKISTNDDLERKGKEIYLKNLPEKKKKIVDWDFI